MWILTNARSNRGRNSKRSTWKSQAFKRPAPKMQLGDPHNVPNFPRVQLSPGHAVKIPLEK